MSNGNTRFWGDEPWPKRPPSSEFTHDQWIRAEALKAAASKIVRNHDQKYGTQNFEDMVSRFETYIATGVWA